MNQSACGRYVLPTPRQIRRPLVRRWLSAAAACAAVIGLPAAAQEVAVLPRRGTCPHDSSFAVHGAGAARADAIRSHATNIRIDAFARLLGNPTPAPWAVRCVIHVHASEESFAAAVGGQPAGARGATSLQFVGDRVTSRRIDVMGDGPAIVPDSLAHEIVHVVLADHFVSGPPPRWADEGLALLFDDIDKQRKHDRDFREAHRRDAAWSAADLLRIEEYPEASARQRVFYGQAASLVRWLVARRDAATFVRFLDDCGTVGESAALQRHYALPSVESLSMAWRDQPPINAMVSRTEDRLQAD